MMRNSALLMLSLCVSLFATTQGKPYTFSGGTTILALIDKDSIVIAADSKIVISNGSQTDSYHTLKIRGRGNIFYAISSDVLYITDNTNRVVFNAYGLMDSLVQRYGELDSAFFRFNITAYKQLDSLFQIMPAALVNKIMGDTNKKLMEVVIVSFKNGEPIYQFSTFGFIDYAGRIRVAYIVTTKKMKVPFMHFCGVYDNITKLLLTTNYELEKDVKQQLINLIRHEAKNNSHGVGEPIDVLAIYPHKLRKWLTDNRY